LIPALLRAYLRVNEILSTLVFNFLAALFLEYLLTGPMKGTRVNLPESDALPQSAWLPNFIPGTRAHWAVPLVILVALAVMAVERTPVGYRLRLYGASPGLARHAGVNERIIVITTLMVSGAAAGVAGWMQTAGVDHRLYATVADTIGYTGLFAALMGRLHPIGIVLSALVFATLLRGGDSLQIGAGVSPEIISALVGLILLLLAARSSPRLKALGA
jgi:general nucleoside transport system permease protein